jgi:hypothetical protein
MTLEALQPWVPVLALFVPALSALLVKYQPDGSSGNWQRSLLASAVAAVLGLIGLVTDGAAIDVDSLVPAIGIPVGTQLVAYLVAWQHLDINEKVAPEFGVLNR